MNLSPLRGVGGLTMSEELEQKLLRKIEYLEREIKSLKGEDTSEIPIYHYSKITFSILHKLFNLKKMYTEDIFQEWFNSDIHVSDGEIQFLEKLLSKYGKFLRAYKEETLKANFIIPILNQVDFLILEKGISGFYEEVITYKTDSFIISGNTDFVVSKGLEYCEKPYFFIQEFKKSKEVSDPEPQLLAELICAIELNNFNSIKGAYIVGSIWNFVILEKLEKNRYQYFVSQNFDSTKINDLKDIYKNLLFVKNEIFNNEP